jgi:hypothetical protein
MQWTYTLLCTSYYRWKCTRCFVFPRVRHSDICHHFWNTALDFHEHFTSPDHSHAPRRFRYLPLFSALVPRWLWAQTWIPYLRDIPDRKQVQTERSGEHTGREASSNFMEAGRVKGLTWPPDQIFPLSAVYPSVIESRWRPDFPYQLRLSINTYGDTLTTIVTRTWHSSTKTDTPWYSDVLCGEKVLNNNISQCVLTEPEEQYNVSQRSAT